MPTFLVLFAPLLCVVRAVVALTSQEISDGLKPHLSAGSSIYLSSDPAYATEITPRWDIYAPSTYVIGIKPALIADVQTIVKFASQNQIPFLATGGGHGYTASLSELQNGLVLDMGNFNTIEINSTSNSITVGGSVRSLDLAAALQSAGKELPVGQCSCIGFTGFTLGGGIGPYSGMYGPASDSVVSFEMVTGTGAITAVSPTQNADLFWGMKGAGFNYGVVTSAKYTVHEATNHGQAMNADMTFLGFQNGTIWELARSFVGKQPKELSITFSIGYDPSLGINIVGNFIYAGPQETGLKLIKPFLDLKPSNVNVSTILWNHIPSSALYGATVRGCSASGVLYVPHSINLCHVNATNLISVVNFMSDSIASNPALQTAVVALAQYSPVGFHRSADASSAFPHRDTVIYAQIDGFAFQSSDVPAIDQWGKEMRNLMQLGNDKSDLEVYVHFAHGDEGSTAWYTKRKLLQLRALKSKYDPQSLFSFYNSIGSA